MFARLCVLLALGVLTARSEEVPATATLSGWDKEFWYEELPPLKLTVTNQDPHTVVFVRIYPNGAPGAGDVVVVPSSCC